MPLLVPVVRLAGEFGLVKLAPMAGDGTELRNNASKNEATRYERMKAIQAAKHRLQTRQQKHDDEVPPAPVQAVKSNSTFMRTFDNLAPRAKDNFADPDSPIMMISAGFEKCFNNRTTFNSRQQIIVVRQWAADSGELPAILASLTCSTEQEPASALADSG